MNFTTHAHPKPECGLPGCPETPEANGMCVLHEKVRVLGSWVPDRHDRHGEAS